MQTNRARSNTSNTKRAGITSDEFANLVLARGTGMRFPRYYVTFEPKKADINSAQKKKFVDLFH